MGGILPMEQYIILIPILQQINGYGLDQWQLQLASIDFVNKVWLVIKVNRITWKWIVMW